MRKGEYMVDSKKFNETSFSETEDFYSHLKILLMQIIGKQKELVKIFKQKKTKGEYHDLYVQSNTLLLVDVFNNFQSMS